MHMAVFFRFTLCVQLKRTMLLYIFMKHRLMIQSIHQEGEMKINDPTHIAY